MRANRVYGFLAGVVFALLLSLNGAGAASAASAREPLVSTSTCPAYLEETYTVTGGVLPAWDAGQVATSANDSGEQRSLRQPVAAAGDKPANHISGPTNRVLFISSAVRDADTLTRAVAKDVLLIEYEPQAATMADLVEQARKALRGRKALSIAFAAHDYGQNKFHLTGSETVSLGSTLADKEQRDFWQDIGDLAHDQGRIDLLACNLAAGDNGGLLIAALQSASGCKVAASVDKTGNPASGGNWLLEAGQIDTAACYFDFEKLAQYQGLMMSQGQKLTASDGAAGADFGTSVSLYGDRALVGAHEATIGGNSDQGAAYVFDYDSGTDTWTQKAKLTASDGAVWDHFGCSVTLDGDRALVGAHGANIGGNSDQGAAYVFELSSGTWTQTAKLTASDGAANADFGTSVTLDGDRALVGASGDDSDKGAAYVFDYDSGTDTWTQTAKLTAGDGAANADFGISVSLDGDRALVGAEGDDSDKGAAYVFDYDSGTDTWTQKSKLTASDGAAWDVFGCSVSLDGDRALSGANRADIGGNLGQGAAYVFDYDSGTDTWTQKSKLTASDGAAWDVFGISVSLDGDRALVGANGDDSGKGAAYVFGYDSGTDTWTQKSKLTASDGAANADFGCSVSLDGDRALVGAEGDDSGKGAAYVFVPSYYRSKVSGSWSDTNTWEESTDGTSNWVAAQAAPDETSLGVTIRNGHTVNVDADTTIDQTTVDAGGTLTVPNAVTLTVVDGDGMDLDVNGTFAIAEGADVDCQGGFDATGGAVTFTGAGALYLSGDVVSLGTLTPGEGTVGFAGATAQTLTGSNTFYNLVIDKDNATDTVDASGGTLVVTNGLSVTTGVFTSASSFRDVIISPLGTLDLSGDITVSGDWQNLWGTFTHNSRTVTLNGTDQYLFGSTTFYNLTKQTASAAALEFEESSTTTIENTLTLEGAAGKLLSLRSDWAEHQWNIDPQGTRNIAYVDVQDSNNISATAINAGETSFNSLRNTNWLFFPRVSTQAVSGIGTTMAMGNGNITDLGTPNPTAHGVCWNTTGNPTLADPHQDNGAASSTGAFTADISGLTGGVAYYVRAFVTNDAGTAYGDPVSFKTQVALTMAVSPAAGGTTTPAAGSTTNLDAGAARNITATPATDWHFVNWTADPAGNAAFGNPASASTTVTLIGSATVTANFTPTYAVTYNANNATSGTAPGPQTKIHDAALILATNSGNLARTGYTYAGWNTAADGSGTNYAAGGQYTANAAVTLYARWTANTYTVTFDANGGSGPVPASKSVTYGDAYGDLAMTSRQDYTFAGWFTAVTGGTPVTSGTMVTTASNHTLYARWAAQPPIPTLSEWSMIILITLLAGITLWRLRRETT